MADQSLSRGDKAVASLRRLIRIVVAPGEARGVVIDEFHHFRVALRHRDGVVTQVESEAARVPYTLCPSAGARLAELIGVPLSRRVTDIHALINGRLQCTHQFDLAALTIAAAARGEDRNYRVLVTDPVDGFSDYSAQRSDGFTLEWRAEGRIIVSPTPFAGVNMREGFTDWASRTLDEDKCEAALILRRAQMIANGRLIMDELKKIGHARPSGGCWVQQPERAPQAKYMWCDPSDGLIDPEPNADDEAWLRGR